MLKIVAKTKKIAEARCRAGMSMREMAGKSNLNVTNISNIENGKVNPHPKTAKHICDALRLTFDDLFELVDVKEALKNETT